MDKLKVWWAIGNADRQCEIGQCEIEGCGDDASVRMENGVIMCAHCSEEALAVDGWGAVYFGGRWHGIRGIRYTAQAVAAYPGLEGGRDEKAN